jgi:transcriptional regulator with GAF, ATPase, and Fis domain
MRPECESNHERGYAPRAFETPIWDNPRQADMPKIVAIEGPSRGAEFEIGPGETTIGRSSTNQIAIADIALSRHHCVVSGEGGAYLLRDLESNNGTLLNDVPIGEHALAHGDRIAVGDSVLVFLMQEEEEAEVFVDSRLLAGSTIHLNREEAFYLHPERFAESAAPAARLVRDLHSLLNISRIVASAETMQSLARELLQLVCAAAAAERGALLLIETPRAEPASDGGWIVFGWDRGTGSDSQVPISSTVVDRVLKDGVALSTSDVRRTEGLASAESLLLRRVTSVLAVPVMLAEHILGVIYLESSDPAAAFDKGHLQWVSAVSGMVALAIENLRRVDVLRQENRRLHTDAALDHSMIGESPALSDVLRLLSRVAPTDSTVLIFGESGTGKELAARAIHHNSRRADRAFVAINCAVLGEALLESDLFGHERGAFTGAIGLKKGKIEIADGGTLFLDEVGELAPALQAKLLRVLQEREFERVGGTRPIKVDVRLIAATNRDLIAAVKKGLFRQDLFYRLNVVSLTMPALRERREDIKLLASYFVQKFSKKCGRRIHGLSNQARALLENYSWPGNVRELENVIERAVVLGEGELIGPEDLADNLLQVTDASVPIDEYHAAVNDARRQIILRAFEKAKGSYTGAARILGIQPTYLHRLIRNLDLKSELKASAAFTMDN